MYHKLKRDYDKFYAEGGWNFDIERERRFLRDRIISPLGLRAGGRVLDLGCGMGHFSNLFHEAGFEVVGLDRSEAGIAHASSTYPGPEFVHADADAVFDRFPPESLDVVFIRGMSWYHYELNEPNKHGVDVPEKTRRLFRLLVPDGHFILQIKTDFSGARPSEGVYHLEVDEFRRLFAPLGEIVLVTDWDGTPLADNRDGAASGRNIVIATRRRPVADQRDQGQ